MQITMISGSHRKSSQSEKVASYIAERQKELYPLSTVSLISLGQNPIPLWEEGMQLSQEPWKSGLKPILETLQASDAIVWVIPEWNGMIPSGVSNLLLHCTPAELGHKPALLASVSASMNGVYPINQMRLNTSKNNRGVYLPEHLIVRYVEKVLNEKENPQSDEDRYIRSRIDYCLHQLNLYADCMMPIRKSELTSYDQFPNGM